VIEIAKRLYAKIYSIPVAGYLVRLVVALAKLPRINMHLRRLEQQQGDAQQKLDKIDAGWHQHVPAFLNAVSSVGAFGHQLARQRADAQQRSERVDEHLRRLTEELERTLNSTRKVEERTAAALAAQIEQQKGLVQDLLRNHLRPLREFAETLRNEQKLARDLTILVERYSVKIGEVEQRLEFVRREIMFECRYGGIAQKTPTTLTPRVVNSSALMNGALRLNLGCGHVPLAGYVNIDARDLPNVDVVATLDNLPFEKGTVSEILLAHVLEHFPQEELRLKLLPYWVGLLQPGGIFRAIVPDAEAMITAYASGTYPFEDFREVFFGAQEYSGDFHFNMFTPASLNSILEQSGLQNVATVAAARRNGKCFEFEVTAAKLTDSNGATHSIAAS
jgi:hypothetical protein